MTAIANQVASDTQRSSQAEQLLEHVADWRTSEVVVDRPAGKIQNVVLVGCDSRNGYRYKPEALREAIGLYDGKIVFLDHATDPNRPRQRSTRDVAGTLMRPRFVDGKLRGDIATVDTEAGRTLLGLAESNRPGVGMSHVVLARRNEDGTLVEKIHDVVSVDAVVFPATAASFREQQECEAQLAEDAESQKAIDSFGSATGNTSPELPQQASSAEEERLFESRAEGLSLAARLIQLTQGLENLLEQVIALMEQRDQLRSEVERRSADDQRRSRRERVEQIVEECQLPRDAASDVFLDLLAACGDETQVRALIEDRRSLAEVSRRQGPKSRERRDDGARATDPSAALVAAITGQSMTKSARFLNSEI